MLVRRWCDRIGEIANVGVCRGAAKESVLPACRSSFENQWSWEIQGITWITWPNFTIWGLMINHPHLGLTIPYSFPCHYQGDTTTAIPSPVHVRARKKKQEEHKEELLASEVPWLPINHVTCMIMHGYFTHSPIPSVWINTLWWDTCSNRHHRIQGYVWVLPIIP